MKNINKTLLISLIAFNLLSFQVLFAQLKKGDENLSKSEREIHNILSVNIEDYINLYITQGNTTGLTIETDKNLHKYVLTEVKGNHLRIYVDKGIKKAIKSIPYLVNNDIKGVEIINSPKINVYLTIKNIKGIRASDASDVYSEGIIKVKDLSVICSGGSDIKLMVDAEELKIEASGGSDVDLKGNATSFRVRASGGSDIFAKKLIAKDCHIEASGGSEAKINVRGSLYLRTSGSSNVSYSGRPTKIDSNK